MAEIEKFPGNRIFWNGHDILRAYVDPVDIYHYTMAILGLKRFYDLHSEMGDAWQELLIKRIDVGTAINQAFQEIDEVYLKGEGIFQGLDFNDNKFPDSHTRDTKLHEFLNIMGFYRFNNPNIFTSTEMVEEFGIFVNEVFQEQYPRLFSFHLPRSIVRLMTRFVKVKDNDTLYDPFCTDGLTLLLPAVTARKNGKKTELYVQVEDSKNLLTINLNRFYFTIEEVFLQEGDIIRSPGFLDGERVKKFNKIITVIPILRKNWGEEFADNDPYRRFTYGRPPGTYGEFAYLQHCIASLPEDGQLIAMVIPGILFRSGKEGDIRAKIIKDDLIEAVILLPKGMLPGTGIPVAIMVLNKNKTQERRNKILFINAQGRGHAVTRNMYALSDADIEEIVQVLSGFEEHEGCSVIKTIDEVAQNEFSLSIDRYFPKDDTWNPEIDLDDKIKELTMIRKKREEISGEIEGYLNQIRRINGT